MNIRQTPQPPSSSFVVGNAGESTSMMNREPCDPRLKQHRRPLATSQYVLEHPTGQEPISGISPSSPQRGCAHYFVDPLSWMRPELEQGKLDGRLECPKCKTNVGKYAWQGMQCSCGKWVVPGISLAKGRIDEVKSKTPGTATLGIRMPPSSPGRRQGPGQQNL